MRISKRRMNKYFGGGKIQDKQLPSHDGENILLIIDPQNDFSDGKRIGDNPGNLQVIGSTLDYKRIIEFIEKNADKLDEIHVSLDTHTTRHIGHPAFWSRVNETGNLIEGKQDNTDDTDGLRILSIVEDKENIYKGVSVIPMDAPEFLHGNEQIRYYTPRKYDERQYDHLLNYVKEYIRFYYSEENKHGLVPWIWRTHCIEGTVGHQVAKELKDCLDKYPGKVHYHIKGQNNLAEMYSIFSAEKPVTTEESRKLSTYLYTGTLTKEGLLTEGVPMYDEVITYKNLKTDSNSELMQYLLRENNRVFVCGEAKTHCVKSSLIDLMEHAQGVDKNRIVLLGNMSSPIAGAKNDLEEIVEGNFTVFTPNESELSLIPMI
jgi:nicotinamidase-related amidase